MGETTFHLKSNLQPHDISRLIYRLSTFKQMHTYTRVHPYIHIYSGYRSFSVYEFQLTSLWSVWAYSRLYYTVGLNAKAISYRTEVPVRETTNLFTMAINRRTMRGHYKSVTVSASCMPHIQVCAEHRQCQPQRLTSVFGAHKALPPRNNGGTWNSCWMTDPKSAVDQSKMWTLQAQWMPVWLCNIVVAHSVSIRGDKRWIYLCALDGSHRSEILGSFQPKCGQVIKMQTDSWNLSSFKIRGNVLGILKKLIV